MSLICNHPDTPTPVMCKTWGVGPDALYVDGAPVPVTTFLDTVAALLGTLDRATITVRIHGCTLAVDDLFEVTMYVLTNTNLTGPQDPRLAFVEHARSHQFPQPAQDFVEEVRRLTTVPGYLVITDGREVATQRLGPRAGHGRRS
jgi:hypothetical protein